MVVCFGLQSLLQNKPSERLNLQQVLQHPFLCDDPSLCVSKQVTFPPQTLGSKEAQRNWCLFPFFRIYDPRAPSARVVLVIAVVIAVVVAVVVAVVIAVVLWLSHRINYWIMFW